MSKDQFICRKCLGSGEVLELAHESGEVYANTGGFDVCQSCSGSGFMKDPSPRRIYESQSWFIQHLRQTLSKGQE